MPTVQHAGDEPKPGIDVVVVGEAQRHIVAGLTLGAVNG